MNALEPEGSEGRGRRIEYIRRPKTVLREGPRVGFEFHHLTPLALQSEANKLQETLVTQSNKLQVTKLLTTKYIKQEQRGRTDLRFPSKKKIVWNYVNSKQTHERT